MHKSNTATILLSTWEVERTQLLHLNMICCLKQPKANGFSKSALGVGGRSLGLEPWHTDPGPHQPEHDAPSRRETKRTKERPFLLCTSHIVQTSLLHCSARSSPKPSQLCDHPGSFPNSNKSQKRHGNSTSL